MDIVTYKQLKLYTNQKNILQPITVKQEDGLSRYLKITLMSDENVVELLDTDNVIINVKRSDNQSQAFSGSISDGIITVPIPAWLMKKTGRSTCSVSCFRLLGYELSADTEVDENKTYYTESGGVYTAITPVGNEDPSALGWYEAQIAKLSSNAFYIDVQELEYDGEDISDDPNYNVLLNLIAQVQALEEAWQLLDPNGYINQIVVNNNVVEFNNTDAGAIIGELHFATINGNDIVDENATGDLQLFEKADIDITLAHPNDNTKVLSEKAVNDNFIPKTDIDNDTSNPTSTTKVLSEKAVVDNFIDKDNIDTTIPTTPVNTKVPSTKIVDDTFLKKNGYSENAGVGYADSAGQLISKTYVEDKVPYNYRTSGGSADIGDREYDTIVGGSIVWNQLARELSSSYWQFENANGNIADHIATFTATAKNGKLKPLSAYRPTFINGHKYLMACYIKTATATTQVGINTGFEDISTIATTNWQLLAGIVNWTATTGVWEYPNIADRRTSDWDAIQVKNVMLIDLTQMFGSTIADYVATLQDGASWFKNLFPKPYYAYNAGAFAHVNVSSHNMVGFNQWGEEWELGRIDTTTGANQSANDGIRSKNYIVVLPNTAYYFKGSFGRGIFFYDSNKDYIASSVQYGSDFVITTPANCQYVRFALASAYGTTYNHDICINLSWSGYRNGEYEAYEKLEYPLDSSLTLRGIPKLDADNNLYYDGDTYEADGTVTREYSIVDLGSLNFVAFGNDTYYASLPNVKTNTTNILSDKYSNASSADVSTMPDKSCKVNAGLGVSIWVRDTSGTISGYLVYELATPTTESATEFTTPQIVNDFGTEEYVVTTQLTDVDMPVGHDTKYTNNLRDKIQRLPEMPESDGTYVVNYTSRQCSFTSLATWLSNNGYEKVEDVTSQITDVAGLTYSYKKAYKVGKMIHLYLQVVNQTSGTIAGGTELFNLGSIKPAASMGFIIAKYTGSSLASFEFSINYNTGAATGSDFERNNYIYINITYAIA